MSHWKSLAATIGLMFMICLSLMACSENANSQTPATDTPMVASPTSLINREVQAGVDTNTLETPVVPTQEPTTAPTETPTAVTTEAGPVLTEVQAAIKPYIAETIQEAMDNEDNKYFVGWNQLLAAIESGELANLYENDPNSLLKKIDPIYNEFDLIHDKQGDYIKNHAGKYSTNYRFLGFINTTLEGNEAVLGIIGFRQAKDGSTRIIFALRGTSQLKQYPNLIKSSSKVPREGLLIMADWLGNNDPVVRALFSSKRVSNLNRLINDVVSNNYFGEDWSREITMVSFVSK